MSQTIPFLYKLTIDNGTLLLGRAVRYFANKYCTYKNNSAITGRMWKCEAKMDDTYEHYLPFGETYIQYEGYKYLIVVNKTGDPEDALINNLLYPSELIIYLQETPDIKFEPENYELYEKYKEENSQKLLEVVDKFIVDAKLYYETKITELEDKQGEIGIYIFDDYWELLNRHSPRKISTVCLDGKEKEILDYITKFKSSETQKKFMERGIPYKKNIMFEGYPGTGKTSLVFSLASELDCNVAIINFSRDMDDNNFMRAIRRLPKNCILVLEDIDVLFKERKENDGNKSSISFSALLNTLDGLAFRQGMITIMTTNYLCNLDSALKRPGRIDKILHFGTATKGQTEHMYHKFFPDKEAEFGEFWKKIRHCKYTTAILQQYLIWYMEDYNGLCENIEEFKKLCHEHNYESSGNLYS